MSRKSLVAIESTWKQFTLSANTFFEEKKYDRALSQYRQALSKAEALNEQPEKCRHLAIPSIQIYIISCNNLSNTHIALGHLEEAELMLKRVIYYLFHLVDEYPSIKEEILKELGRALTELLSFGKLYGGSQDYNESLLAMLKEVRAM